METPAYKATKTRSDRPGWSVTFRHPKRTDSGGRPGLKIRRGLNTADEGEADRLVEQLNELLNDQDWWSADRRTEAMKHFDEVIVAVFFDKIEAGKTNSAELRDSKILLPTKKDGYSRVLFLGTTGAGKTTLLRHVIGSDHTKDRFPSISTARTTTADTEIVTAEGHFKAVVTFMSKSEVRSRIRECLEEACLCAVQQEGDLKIANALLSHREQRFRMSYILGPWQDENSKNEKNFSFDDEPSDIDKLREQETVSTTEAMRNQQRLTKFVNRIKGLVQKVHDTTAKSDGMLDEKKDEADQTGWLETFIQNLCEHERILQNHLGYPGCY